MEELSARGVRSYFFLLESLVACSGRCSVLTAGQGPTSRAPALCIAIAARTLLLLLLLLLLTSLLRWSNLGRKKNKKTRQVDGKKLGEKGGFRH